MYLEEQQGTRSRLARIFERDVIVGRGSEALKSLVVETLQLLLLEPELERTVAILESDPQTLLPLGLF